jgi:TfoX/Sxy family transcriptional regulator of competence genes
MPYAQKLADRVRRVLGKQEVAFEAKPMMGGLCFMVGGKMCVGIVDERLMLRIDPAIETEALKKLGCKPMDFTGRLMKGFVFVEPVSTSTAAELSAWLRLALDFNPRATASKKRPPRKAGD